MILGQGLARTDADILVEYQQFLRDNHIYKNKEVQRNVQTAPPRILHQVGKPIAEWADEDIVALFDLAPRASRWRYVCGCFIAFLLFRGYIRPSIELMASLPIQLSRLHTKALEPIRARLVCTATELGYVVSVEGSYRERVGREMTLLILFLAYAHKPLEQVTRADYDAFYQTYVAWYQTTEREAYKNRNPRLARLEHFLVHWGVISPAKPVLCHEQRFASLVHDPIRVAILTYMRWCEVKYRPSTIRSRWAAINHFFIWLQEQYPEVDEMHLITRLIALEYTEELKRRVDTGTFSANYRNRLYQGIRAFLDFAIDENLPNSPARNPFHQNDTPRKATPIPRYLNDQEIHAVLTYCEQQATLLERVLVITLLHTGIRSGEMAMLKASDIVQVQDRWKLHIHEGKGLKDRMIPLTQPCLTILRKWQEHGWERATDRLFTRYGRPWTGGQRVSDIIRQVGQKAQINGLTPHRFRHTFAVTLINYGMRESAIQKLMGHTTLNMTLEYARILDTTVEQAFNDAVAKMESGPLNGIPSFFSGEEYSLFAEGDAMSWIRLPHGYCRRNPKLHCESDVKCLLCERFAAFPEDIPRLKSMYERFQTLGLQAKAEVVAAQIYRLEAHIETGFVPAPCSPTCADTLHGQTVGAGLR
nr:tyrosine-type recombinase/integrase [Anaerolineae bacterium]